MTTSTRCPHCRGRIESSTNGNGRVIERCASCGRSPDAPVAAPAVGAGVSSREAGKRCPVKGCPGTLDTAGQCPCCAKRAAYVSAHAPKRPCRICGGPLAGRALKFCDACKSLAPLAKKAQAEQEASFGVRRKTA